MDVLKRDALAAKKSVSGLVAEVPIGMEVRSSGFSPHRIRYQILMYDVSEKKNLRNAVEGV
jgi:hypothetical protein